MNKLRAAMHNGKKSQKTGKVIRPPHNDTAREKNPNVNSDLVFQNVYFNCYDNIEYTLTEQNEMEVLSFQEAELLFYKNSYQDALDLQNQVHINARHKDRVKSMNDWLDSPRYAPTETILHVGNVDDGFADFEDMKKMTYNYVECLRDWSDTHGNCLHILDYAIHSDEFYIDDKTNQQHASSIHTHIRYVFDYIDENGNKAIGIEKALEQAGYDLPEPTKKPGRYNNRMMVFTKEFREKWQQIAMDCGYDIETEPLPTKRKSKDRETFVAEKLAEKEIKKAIEMQRDAEQQHINNEEEAVLNAAEARRLAILREQLEKDEAEITSREKRLTEKETKLNDREVQLSSKSVSNNIKAAQLTAQETRLNDKEKALDNLITEATEAAQEAVNLSARIKDQLERDKQTVEAKEKLDAVNEIKKKRSDRAYRLSMVDFELGIGYSGDSSDDYGYGNER